MRQRLAVLGMAAVLTAGMAGGCGSGELTADTTCEQYLDHPSDERAEAARRVSIEVGGGNAGNPMWAASLDQACRVTPDRTLGEYFEGQ